MIPKSLIVSFLSLQVTQETFKDGNEAAISTDAMRTNAIDTSFIPQLKVDYQHSVQPQYQIESERIRFPFDYLPSGDWDPSFVFQGQVSLSNPGSARIWSVPDAFAGLTLKHGGKHAWGPYPQGKTFTVQWTKPVTAASWTFGWLVDRRLRAGAYNVRLYNGASLAGWGDGKWGDDDWTSWGSGQVTAFDKIVVTVTDAVAFDTGILLLEYLDYAW
ncbi:MAG: hypothetical protein M1814_005489 [Vezdaea aestivalis]|nr:MAG: hypothetical protein M1814_005489 [Vezdaea aestivalis]